MIIMLLYHIGVNCCSFIFAGYALQCYTCTFSEVSSSNVVLDFVLDTFSKISNTHCKLENPGTDMYELDVMECRPPVDSSKVVMCADIDGKIHAKVKGTNHN